MPQDQIKLPEQFLFRTTYRVVYSDINAANHLGADRILPIALEAQFGFVRYLGYENAVVFESAGLIMRNSQIDYLAEAFYGDILEVDLAVTTATDKALDFIYSIRDSEKLHEVARVKTRLLCFDYTTQQVVTIPAGFRQRLDACTPFSADWAQ